MIRHHRRAVTDTARQDARHATPAELGDFLARNPGLEYVQLVLTDLNGVSRGKSLARQELDALFSTGRNVAGSILGLDMRGEDVLETRLVWDVGDADQLCRPVPALTPAPWLTGPAAQVLASVSRYGRATSARDARRADIIGPGTNAGLSTADRNCCES